MSRAMSLVPAAPSAALLLASLALFACSSSSVEEMQGEALAYHRDIAPLVQRYCGGCHQEGGIAPFTLSSYADLKLHAPSVRSAVERGTMPPWLPSADSMPLRFSRAMRPEDKAELLRWIDGGLNEGDPAATPRTDLPPAQTLPPTRPDLVLDPGWD
jgi:hypothetical protein